MELTDDRHPQYEISWKLEDKPAETVDAEEWIAKKGVAAKGKKCTSKPDAKSVRFIEPLVKDDDTEPEPLSEESVPDLPEVVEDIPAEEEEPTLF